MSEPMERKTFPFFATKIDVDQGLVTHVVAVMGNVDYGNDVIHPGAFTKTIAERGGKVRVLDNHNRDSIMSVVGKPVRLWEVSRGGLPLEVLEHFPEATGGLMAETQFLMETPEGKGTFVRIKEGAVDEYSIGYDALDADYSTRSVDGENVDVRNLRTMRLWEYGPVIWGMNPATATLAAKGDGPNDGGKMETKPEPEVTENTIRIRVHDPGDFEEDSFSTITIGSEDDGIQAVVGTLKDGKGRRVQAYIFDKEKWTVARAQKWVDDHKGDEPELEDKGVTGAINLPLAERGRPWDAGAAEQRVRSWAGAEDKPNAKYRRAFFWYDADKPENFTSYKLQFADVIDGKLTAVPRGIFAVANVLQGARGGVDISEADQNEAKDRVSRYYAKMRTEFDDDGIMPPWEKAADDEHEEKIGRVLSAANAREIVSALERLMAVLERAGVDIPGFTTPEEEESDKSAPVESEQVVLENKEDQPSDENEAGPTGKPLTAVKGGSPTEDDMKELVELAKFELELKQLMED